MNVGPPVGQAAPLSACKGRAGNLLEKTARLSRGAIYVLITWLTASPPKHLIHRAGVVFLQDLGAKSRRKPVAQVRGGPLRPVPVAGCAAGLSP